MSGQIALWSDINLVLCLNINYHIEKIIYCVKVHMPHNSLWTFQILCMYRNEAQFNKKYNMYQQMHLLMVNKKIWFVFEHMSYGCFFTMWKK